MPYASLRDFIARLEQNGRLVRVKAPVSPHLARELDEEERTQDRADGEQRLDGGRRVVHGGRERPQGDVGELPEPEVDVLLHGVRLQGQWGGVALMSESK